MPRAADFLEAPQPDHDSLRGERLAPTVLTAIAIAGSASTRYLEPNYASWPALGGHCIPASVNRSVRLSGPVRHTPDEVTRYESHFPYA